MVGPHLKWAQSLGGGPGSAQPSCDLGPYAQLFTRLRLNAARFSKCAPAKPIARPGTRATAIGWRGAARELRTPLATPTAVPPSAM